MSLRRNLFFESKFIVLRGWASRWTLHLSVLPSRNLLTTVHSISLGIPIELLVDIAPKVVLRRLNPYLETYPIIDHD